MLVRMKLNVSVQPSTTTLESNSLMRFCWIT